MGSLDNIYDDDYKKPTVKIVYKEEEVDKLTKMLCYILGTLTDFTYCDLVKEVTDENINIKKWWDNHKKSDCQRLTAEMINYLDDNYINVDFPNTKEKLVQYFIEKELKNHPVSSWHKTYFFGYCANIAMERVKNRHIAVIKSKLTSKEYEALKEFIKSEK